MGTSGSDVPAQRGIPCPRCGCCDLRTVRTMRVGRHIRRYKVCRHCGRRLVTCEQATGDRSV